MVVDGLSPLWFYVTVISFESNICISFNQFINIFKVSLVSAHHCVKFLQMFGMEKRGTILTYTRLLICLVMWLGRIILITEDTWSSQFQRACERAVGHAAHVYDFNRSLCILTELVVHVHGRLAPGGTQPHNPWFKQNQIVLGLWSATQSQTC